MPAHVNINLTFEECRDIRLNSLFLEPGEYTVLAFHFKEEGHLPPLLAKEEYVCVNTSQGQQIPKGSTWGESNIKPGWQPNELGLIPGSELPELTNLADQQLPPPYPHAGVHAEL